MYPAYRKKNDKVNSYAERVQGCFQFSMNGTPPAADSHVINALTAYSYWLSTGAPTGQELPGRAYPEVPQPQGGFDIAKGKQIYAEQCAVCHGDDGQGQKAGGGYVFPPLWGKDSFNWGAGMHRINTAAAFIKESMPLGKGGSLSDADAWHVAAYMNSHERPQDPRLIEGSVEKTRLKYHANDGVNPMASRSMECCSGRASNSVAGYVVNRRGARWRPLHIQTERSQDYAPNGLITGFVICAMLRILSAFHAQ